MLRYTTLFSLLFIASLSYAQKKDKDIREYIPTENQNPKKDANRAKYRSKKKKYNVIYRPHVKNILYGNPCAVEATHKMGFEYLVESNRIRGSKSQKGKFLNNIWVKTQLVATRSPFWKWILKKRFKRCRHLSGDFTG